MAGELRFSEKSDAVAFAARLRRMRIARDACWVIVAAAIGATGLVFLDAAVTLPSWGRGLGLAVWVTSVAVLAWRWFARRWQSEPNAVVPTAQNELPSNLAAAAAAAVSLIGCILSGLIIPGAGEHLRRVALPWQRPTTDPYHIVVTSGDPVVRRGNPVTLSAYAEKLDPNVATPTAGWLVFRNRGNQVERRLPMMGDGNGAFHVTLPSVQADLEYHIEIGMAKSNWYHITAMEAAEVTDGSRITIRPPSYASSATHQVIRGFMPFKSFQHTTAEVHLRFTRPLSTAILEWQPTSSPSELLTLTIATNRLEAEARLHLIQQGTLRLITYTHDGGKSLRWETAIRVDVEPDQPPRLEQLSGAWVRMIRPGDRLRIGFAVNDDIAVASAVVEYREDSVIAPPQLVPIRLVGSGTARATGQIELTVPEQAGRVVGWRIRVSDTRKLDELQLEPQETVFPRTGWITVRVDPTAPPQEQQEVLGHQQAIDESLTALLTQLREVATQIRELDATTTGQTPLVLDQVVRLQTAQDQIHQLGIELDRTATIAALSPALRSLAQKIRSTATEPLIQAETELRESVTDHPTQRAIRLAMVGHQLRTVELALPELIRRNDQLARVRMASIELASLAAAQAELAGQIRPDTKLTIDELAQRQQVLLKRFRELLSEAEPIRSTTAAAQIVGLRQLLERVDNLSGQLHELDVAIRQLIADEHSLLLTGILHEHDKLRQQTAELFRTSETPARLGNLRLPRAENLRHVALMMEQGKILEVLTELQKFAGELDQCAAQIQSQVLLRTDPKRAVQDLANWQNDLYGRFQTATSGIATAFGNLPQNVQAAFRAEQGALATAVAAARLPPGDTSIRTIHENAQDHLAAANRFLAGSGANADTAMKMAINYLNQLAEKIPTISERLLKSRGDIEKLRLEQAAILLAVEQILRNADPASTTQLAKRLSPVLERQRNLLAVFTTLDLPGLESRCMRIRSALSATIGDLRDGSPLDVIASQAWVRRELDRLKAVLDGSMASDEQANELARRMKAIQAAIGLHPTEMQLKVQSTEVQEIRQHLERLLAPEAPLLLNEARDAVQSADLAFRNGSKPGEVVRLVTVAANALDRLAARMNGRESDLDRVRRLAANRRLGAEEARKLLGLTPPAGPAGEVARQLSREIEELTHTRVGAAAQLRKRQLLDQYTKLKDDPTPEKWAGIHANLAEKLDELAALMVDVADLITTADLRAQPEPISIAETYLPSKQLADALRELAHQYRLLHRRIANLTADLVSQLNPIEGSASAALIQKHQSLATSMASVTAQLDTAAKEIGVDTTLGRALADAAHSLRAAERLLQESAAKAGMGQLREAEQTRKAATAALAKALTGLSQSIPKENAELTHSELAIGEALRAAEGAMRRAIAQLKEQHNTTDAQATMNKAAEAIKKAIRMFED